MMVQGNRSHDGTPVEIAQKMLTVNHDGEYRGRLVAEVAHLEVGRPG